MSSPITLHEQTQAAKAILALAGVTPDFTSIANVCLILEINEALSESLGIAKANEIMALITNAGIPNGKK